MEEVLEDVSYCRTLEEAYDHLDEEVETEKELGPHPSNDLEAIVVKLEDRDYRLQKNGKGVVLQANITDY